MSFSLASIRERPIEEPRCRYCDAFVWAYGALCEACEANIIEHGIEETKNQVKKKWR